MIITRNIILILTASVGLLLPTTTQAVVVLGEPTFGLDDAETLGDPFEAVVDIFASSGGGGSGTGILISPTRVLTAKHLVRNVASSNGIFMDFNDTDGNRISPTIRSNGWVTVTDPVSNVSDIDGTDLAIVTLQSAVTGITPMRLLGDMSYGVGKQGLMVGFGFHGEGNVVDTNGDPVLDFGDIRHAGANVIESYGAAASPAGFFPNSTNIFSTDFDNGTAGNNTIAGSSLTPLAQESTTASGDSGGPLLVLVNNEWLIAGVLTGGTTSTSEYGDISHWTGVGPYQALIEQNGGEFVAIPEPTSLALISVGALLVATRRRA